MQRIPPATTALVGLMSAVVSLTGCNRKQPEQAAAPAAGKTAASAPAPAASTDYPTRVFFGDTHLHTALSMDAGAAGANLLPADAYRFAKGEEVTGASGQKAKLSRPLDFLVVSDHSDQMGLITDLKAGKPELLAVPMAKRWYDLMQAGKSQEAIMDLVTNFAQGKFPKEIQYIPGTPGYIATWQGIIKAAEDANQPGKFTAFIGYEWTSLVKGNNLHRNVIFRDNADKASQVEPFIAGPPGSPDPRELWKWMQSLRNQDRRPGAGDPAQRQSQ